MFGENDPKARGQVDSISLAGNTAGNTSAGTGPLVLAGGNNITLSAQTAIQGGMSVTVSGPTVILDAQGISTGGNTAGQTGLVSQQLVFVGGNNITLSGSVNAQSATITISAGGGGAVNISAGTTSNNLNALTFADSNGLSWGLNASTITVSYTVPPVNTANTAIQSVQGFVSAGTMTSYARADHAHAGVAKLFFGSNTKSGGGPLTITGDPYVSLSFDTAVNQVTIDWLGQQATTVSAVTSANVLGTASSSFAMQDHQHAGVGLAGVSNIGNTLGNTAVLPGQVVFAGGNNITLSMSTSANNNMTITISAANGGGAGYTAGMSTQGNTAGNTGMVTGQLQLVGSNNLTLSGSTNAGSMTITISGPSAGGMGVSTLGNSAGTTGTVGGQMVMVASGGVTLSQSTNGNSGTITITVTPNATASWFEPEIYGGTTTGTQANGTVYVRPFYVNNYISAYRGQMLMQMTSQSNTTMSFSGSVSGGNASSASGSWGLSGSLYVMSRISTGTDAHSSLIGTFFSQTYTMSMGMSNSVSWSTNASSASVSWTTGGKIGFLSSIDSAGGVTYGNSSTTSSNSFSSTSTNAHSFSSSATVSFASQHLSQIRPIFFPMGTALTPGEYWLAHIQSTNTGSTNQGLQQQCQMNSVGLVYYTTQIGTQYQEVGNSVTIASSNLMWGLGSYSSSGNLTAVSGIPISQISNMSGYSLFFQLLAQVK